MKALELIDQWDSDENPGQKDNINALKKYITPHISRFLKHFLAIFSVPCHWSPDRMLPVLDPIFVNTAGLTSSARR